MYLYYKTASCEGNSNICKSPSGNCVPFSVLKLDFFGRKKKHLIAIPGFTAPRPKVGQARPATLWLPSPVANLNNNKTNSSLTSDYFLSSRMNCTVSRLKLL
jgi:hypothetical protein